jgi:hypothetical protein
MQHSWILADRFFYRLCSATTLFTQTGALFKLRLSQAILASAPAKPAASFLSRWLGWGCVVLLYGRRVFNAFSEKR